MGASLRVHVNSGVLFKNLRNTLPPRALPLFDSNDELGIQILIPCRLAGKNLLTSLAPTTTLRERNEFSSFRSEEERSSAVVSAVATVSTERWGSAGCDSVGVQFAFDLLETHAVFLVHIDNGNVFGVIGAVASLANLVFLATLETTLEQCGICDELLRDQHWFCIHSPVVLSPSVTGRTEPITRIVEVLVSRKLSGARRMNIV